MLNSYFSGWSRGEASNRLPFTYNTTPTASYRYEKPYPHNEPEIYAKRIRLDRGGLVKRERRRE